MENTKHQSTVECLEKDADILSENISPGEIIIGTIQGIDKDGQTLVDFLVNKSVEGIPAISTISVSHQLIGRQVALLFAEGNLNNPVIMGLIHSPLDEMLENFELSADLDNQQKAHHTTQANTLSTEQVVIDGKRIVIEGQEEIVLKCGESSITLTKAGKIMIRGKYLLNRSTGVNRIMGGSVQVN